MKRHIAAAAAALAAVALAGCTSTGSSAPAASSEAAPSAGSAAPAAGDPLEVGIAQIVAHPSLDALRDGFIEGMGEAGWTEESGTVTYETANAQGDQSTLALIAQNFAAKDLIVAIATPTAQAIAQAVPDKPIFFAGVTDPVGAGLVSSLEEPGGNITGTSDMPPIEEQLALIREILPEAETIGLVYSSSETNSEIQAGMVQDAAPEFGFTVREVTVINSSEVQQATEAITDVDVFFVGTDNTVVSAIETLVAVGERNQIPVIVSDPDSVPRGALAALAVDYFEQGLQTGRMAARMLAEGTDPSAIPVEVASELQLSLNPGAADRMEVALPQSVLDRVDVLVED